MASLSEQNPRRSAISALEEEEKKAAFYVTLVATRVLLKCKPGLKSSPFQLAYYAHRVGEEAMQGLSLPPDYFLREEQIEVMAEDVSSHLSKMFGRWRVHLQVGRMTRGAVEAEMVKAIQRGILELMERTENRQTVRDTIALLLASFGLVLWFVFSIVRFFI